MAQSDPQKLLEQLNSSDLTTKKTAIFNVGRKKISEAIPSLIDLLENDEDSVVRNSAARALGKISDSDKLDEILKALIAALEDPDYYVKANACWSLGKLQDPRAIPALRTMVDPSKRLYTKIGDGKTFDSHAETDASEQLKEEGVKYSDLIVEAIKAIGKIGGTEGVPALISALSDESDGTVRCKAALALGKIGDKRAVQPLIELLQQEKYWYVRRDVIKALAKLKDERAIPELLKKTNDMYNDVRENAVEALMAIGKPAHKAIVGLFIQKPSDSKLQSYLKSNLSSTELKKILESLLSSTNSSREADRIQKFLDQL